MIQRLMTRWLFRLGLVAGLLVSRSGAAQSAPAVRPEIKRTAALPPTPPPLPPSPLDYFRRILAMSATERETLLVEKSPAVRKVLEDKLREYDTLSADERQSRLRALELRWYLKPLMQMPASNRVSRLNAIPETDRPLVEERLHLWDQCPADLQQEILANETAIRYWVRPATAKPSPGLSVTNISPVQRQQIEAGFTRLNALPEEKRQKIYEHFQKFFELNEEQKAKTLDVLTDTERRQMQGTLQMFGRLPKDQRDRCISGFKKFADLSPDEQRQFLQNADRWQAMSAKDREVWRKLVARVLPKPPLPPGVKGRQPPPLPPKAPSMLTNN